MDELIKYLRENMILDFQGDLTVEMVRELLGGDTGPVAQALLAKLADERAVNDMLIVIADCLLEEVQRAVTGDLVHEQLEIYAGS